MLGLLRFSRLNDDPPHIVPAIRAHDVRRRGVAALGAILQLFGFFGVVCAAATGARIRLATLGNSHGSLSTKKGKPVSLKPLSGMVKDGPAGCDKPPAKGKPRSKMT